MLNITNDVHPGTALEDCRLEGLADQADVYIGCDLWSLMWVFVF